MGRLLCSGTIGERLSAGIWEGECVEGSDNRRYASFDRYTDHWTDSGAEGELIDLIEEFSEGRIQFAFCKVKDPNTGLPKSVLIAWVGVVQAESPQSWSNMF